MRVGHRGDVPWTVLSVDDLRELCVQLLLCLQVAALRLELTHRLPLGNVPPRADICGREDHWVSLRQRIQEAVVVSALPVVFAPYLVRLVITMRGPVALAVIERLSLPC